MKKKLLLLPLFSLSLLGCNKSNPNLWNRTFKSSGRVVLNYNEDISTDYKISRLKFLNDNFNNIDWEQSGVVEDYTETPFTPFQPDDYIDLETLKYNLENWWKYYQNFKKMIDHTTTIIKRNDDLTGTVTFHSDINPDKPTDNEFIATDRSDKLDGSYLEINKPDKEVIGYVYYTNYEDVVVIRNGPSYSTSVIKFVFKLIEPVDGIETFNINNYIEIKEHKFKMPWWGIFLIIVGSITLVGIIYLIVKLYRRRHHSY